jgi:septal ring factor EnvC (AmiA/AmiB activator)
LAEKTSQISAAESEDRSLREELESSAATIRNQQEAIDAAARDLEALRSELSQKEVQLSEVTEQCAARMRAYAEQVKGTVGHWHTECSSLIALVKTELDARAAKPPAARRRSPDRKPSPPRYVRPRKPH